MRSDATRNREAIVAAAGEVFRRDGPDASLEYIAERAGVGSATLHRHFRGRSALLRAVYAETVQQLADDAGRWPAPDGLWAWLDAIARHCAQDPLAVATDADADVTGWEPLVRAGGILLDRARDAGVGAPAVTVEDLLALTYAVARIAAGDPDRASSLLALIRVGAGGAG